MTPQEINEAVANKLMVDYCSDPNCTVNCPCEEKLKDYCGDIRAAWEIVEKERMAIYPSGKHWVAILSVQRGDQCHTVADTAPMAIALAFLKLEDKNG